MANVLSKAVSGELKPGVVSVIIFYKEEGFWWSERLKFIKAEIVNYQLTSPHLNNCE